jgi:hypothetical protein
MAGRLVTIATFDRVTEAHFAQGALDAAGIKAAISNEDTAPLFGQFAVAVSGIKVMVQEEDEERAVKVLDDAFEDSPLDEAELEAQAESEAPENLNEAEEHAVVLPSDPAADSASRENDARTAVLAACLGWLTCGIGHMFAIVMILTAASGPGKLTRQAKGNLYVAGFIILSPLLLGVVLALVLRTLGRL